MAKMRILPEDRPRVKAECLRLLATLRLDPARTRLISGFVDTYLRLNATEEQVFQCELDTMGVNYPCLPFAQGATLRERD